MAVRRKALVVGINYYEKIGNLRGCVNDAYGMKAVLERHADGSVNFGVHQLIAPGPDDPVTRTELREAAEELFAGDEEIALFYFAGHGFVDAAGGYLLTSDATSGTDGLYLHELLAFANQSKVRNRVIILDSCHSGVAAKVSSGHSELSEGLTLLTASSETQYASEEHGSGVFTGLLIDALNGGAANLVGEVTPGSAYAHIDQSLGPWAQRPIFKTNVKTFVSLRSVEPPLPESELRRISELFPEPGFEFQLDPTFEPERGPERARSKVPPCRHAGTRARPGGARGACTCNMG